MRDNANPENRVREREESSQRHHPTATRIGSNESGNSGEAPDDGENRRHRAIHAIQASAFTHGGCVYFSLASLIRLAIF